MAMRVSPTSSSDHAFCCSIAAFRVRNTYPLRIYRVDSMPIVVTEHHIDFECAASYMSNLEYWNGLLEGFVMG